MTPGCGCAPAPSPTVVSGSRDLPSTHKHAYSKAAVDAIHRLQEELRKEKAKSKDVRLFHFIVCPLPSLFQNHLPLPSQPRRTTPSPAPTIHPLVPSSTSPYL